MNLKKRKNGFFEVSFMVIGPKKKQKLKAIIDTGSQVSCCTYKIPTTLYSRPINQTVLSTINGKKTRPLLEYNITVDFDQKQKNISVFRIAEIQDGVDFLIGMNLLEHCNIVISGNTAEITWK